MNEGPDPTPPEAPLAPQKKTINAKQFVAAFRERPDDFYLMAKFAVTPSI